MGMESWSGLGKIIKYIKGEFEDYDLDDIAAAHFMDGDYKVKGVIKAERYKSKLVK